MYMEAKDCSVKLSLKNFIFILGLIANEKIVTPEYMKSITTANIQPKELLRTLTIFEIKSQKHKNQSGLSLIINSIIGSEQTTPAEKFFAVFTNATDMDISDSVKLTKKELEMIYEVLLKYDTRTDNKEKIKELINLNKDNYIVTDSGSHHVKVEVPSPEEVFTDPFLMKSILKKMEEDGFGISWEDMEEFLIDMIDDDIRFEKIIEESKHLFPMKGFGYEFETIDDYFCENGYTFMNAVDEVNQFIKNNLFLFNKENKL